MGRHCGHAPGIDAHLRVDGHAGGAGVPCAGGTWCGLLRSIASSYSAACANGLPIWQHLALWVGIPASSPDSGNHEVREEGTLRAGNGQRSCAVTVACPIPRMILRLRKEFHVM